MIEYINREQALYELCNNSIPVFDEDGHMSFVCDYSTVLNSIPAADVVEAVHCKDCKQYEKTINTCLRIEDYLKSQQKKIAQLEEMKKTASKDEVNQIISKLQRAGILDENGNLAAPYNGKDNTMVK